MCVCASLGLCNSDTAHVRGQPTGVTACSPGSLCLAWSVVVYGGEGPSLGPPAQCPLALPAPRTLTTPVGLCDPVHPRLCPHPTDAQLQTPTVRVGCRDPRPNSQ